MIKILCLTSHDLNAPAYGSVLRAQNMFRLLSRFGEVHVVVAGYHKHVVEGAVSPQAGFELLDNIHLAPMQNRPFPERLRHKIDPRFVKIEWREADSLSRERLQNWLAEHDLVWVHSLQVANGFGLWRWPRTVLDVDDIPSSLHRANFSQAGRAGKCWELRQMILWRRHERFLSERFDAICVCSEPDRLKLGGNGNVHVLPNGFAAPKESPARNPVEPPWIGFVGTFLYPPNRDGVRWFIENVWPRILEKFPQARLRLAGESSEQFAGELNVDPLGWVADMETEMAKWSLAIVPVLVGGGTRIKILEAFSRKCPAVSTRLGAYGHNVRNGHDLLLADLPADFAAACLRILTDPAEGERLAENAWKQFIENWTWDANAERIANIVETVLAKQNTILSAA